MVMLLTSVGVTGVVIVVLFCSLSPLHADHQFSRPSTFHPVKDFGECVLKGDPHIHQFDATNSSQRINFGRTCSYILVQTNCSFPYEKPDFYITGSFKFNKVTSKASTVHEIDGFINLGNNMRWGIRLPRNLRGIQVFRIGRGNPIRMIGNAAKVRKTGGYSYRRNSVAIKLGSEVNQANETDCYWKPDDFVAVVTFQNKARIFYDGFSMAKVQLPPSFGGQVCGVCGNFDGDISNDRRTGYLFSGSSWRKGQCNGLRPKGPFGREILNTESMVTSWYWGGSSAGTCREECESGRRGAKKKKKKKPTT